MATVKDRTLAVHFQWARMRDMGHEAINYATAIKAKAMVKLADFNDIGQADGTIAKQGRPENVPAGNVYSLSDVLGTEDSQQARDAVRTG